MSNELTSLQSALADNTVAVAANTTAVNAVVAAGVGNNGDTAALPALTSQVIANTTQIAANTSALNAAANPPTPPTP